MSIFSNGDSSDNYANKKSLFLSFYHLASNKEVKFKAFVENYNESFSTDWTYEEVFGRQDPIATFRQTRRGISVSWVVPAATVEEARENLGRCNLLSQFMYPGYSAKLGANTLSKPPLMKVRFANLIRNAAAADSPNAKAGGLLVACNSLNISPSFDDSSGFFDPGTATLYPKTINISCDFVVLHQHELGWATESRFNSDELSDFPFGGVDAIDPSATPEARANEGEVDLENVPDDSSGEGVEAEVDAAQIDRAFVGGGAIAISENAEIGLGIAALGAGILGR
jgi:hypothetical protein